MKHRVDQCKVNNPCLNKAECFPLEEGGVECRCAAGFTGVLCEENIDDCQNNNNTVCSNGGECHDLVNGYMCRYILFKLYFNCSFWGIERGILPKIDSFLVHIACI